jgi:2-oxoisovalerate dehydrogenase E1 component beta subunit
MKADAVARCERAVAELKARPWPTPVAHASSVAPAVTSVASLVVEDAPAFDPKGVTYLDAVARGLDDVLSKVPESFLLGEDVGPPYGNAFLLLKPLVEKHGARMLNTPIAEGAIIGACVGAALEGMRPIGEIQFNDFVASGFNQLVNNAAKLSFRHGPSADGSPRVRVPMTLRMPWGGLRRAGPYHSQDTAPWFFRTPGLKIVAPSTPHDARALILSAVLDDDPVLFYEHIALYRDPRIKQLLSDAPPAPIPLGRAALRREGGDLALIAYGAYVHKAMRAADALARAGDGECAVLDLRSLAPLDWSAIESVVKSTGKVLLVGEDSRTGSILESIASRIAEEMFEHLDGPVRVRGAQDTPVPYAPSLEDAFLLSEEQILDEARALLRW